jgi:homocysteine S-methyltransferase
MTASPAPAAPLPQLQGHPFVTDGGMETDLIFHHGIDLPHFAAFPLLSQAAGRAALTAYYDGYAEIAARTGAGLLLESPTWRASPDWGGLLGYAPGELDRVNASAITMLAMLREGYAGRTGPVLISGMVGPRGDGYQPGQPFGPDLAAFYHGPQIRVFAEAGADLVSALTLAETGEAIGIVRAARAAGLPVAISFTVETGGRLPGGQTLGQAITAVDAAAPPDYYLVNCAHPVHIGAGLAEPGPPGDWRERIAGVRYNASRRSHAELDEATTLDEGDPRELAAAHRALAPALPKLTVLGGCCGTDARHVAALWDVPAA